MDHQVHLREVSVGWAELPCAGYRWYIFEYSQQCQHQYWARTQRLRWGVAFPQLLGVLHGGLQGVQSNISGGMQIRSPLVGVFFLMDSLSWVPQRCWAILRTWAVQLGHPFRVSQYRVLWTWSLSAAPEITFNFWKKSGCATYCDVRWWGGFVSRRGSGLGGQLGSYPFRACSWSHSHTSTCRVTCSVVRGVWHEWGCAGPSPGVYGCSAPWHVIHRCRCGTSPDQSRLTGILNWC